MLKKHQVALLNVILAGGALAAVYVFGRLADRVPGHRDMDYFYTAVILAGCVAIYATRWVMDALNFVFGRQLVFGIFSLPLIFIISIAFAKFIVPIGIVVHLVRFVVLRIHWGMQQHKQPLSA